MAAGPTSPQEIVPTSLAIFKDVDRPFLQVAAAVPTTPVRSTTHPADESSFLASGDCSKDRGVGKTPLFFVKILE
eukprot:1313432-Amphidinium_carterae.1